MLAFQPHRYTRTATASKTFVKVMGQADAVLLVKSMPQARPPSWRPMAACLARALRVPGKIEPVFVDDIAAMPHGYRGQRPRR